MKGIPLFSGLMLVLTVVFITPASAVLQCTVCAPPCPPVYTANIFNLSDDGSAFIGTTDREVRCYETAGGTLSNTGTDTYNVVVIRISDLQAAHSQRGDTPPPNYPYPVNLSSSNRILSCGYIPGDCLSNGWQTCVASLSEDTNAHAGDCSRYSLKVCCNASLADTTGPVCSNIWISPPSRAPWTNQIFDVLWSCTDPSGISRYNLRYNVTHTNGSPDTPWTLLYSGPLTSYSFTPAANNHTYYFRVNATDNEGNTGDYSSPMGTTFDNENPNITYNITDDQINKRITITSFAWDNVSGILNHNISCIAINPSSTNFSQCSSAAPFGGISPCQTDAISYTNETEISCEIRAEDRAGNANSTNIFFTSAPDNLIMKLHEHNIFISMGESYHIRIQLRNIKPTPDMINVSLQGTYPPGLAKFLQSSPIIWISLDKRNITALLNPYEQKTIYVEIISTDQGDYTLDLQAGSQTYPIKSNDSLSIMIGFPAYFTGIGFLSAVMLVIASSALFYWKTRE